jgi:hypothetical protein
VTTIARPQPPATDDTHAKDDAPAPNPPARLSIKQIVASALAAVSTTVMLSHFGIAGTIIGAGLASVFTVVANYLYTRSIERTHEALLPVVCQVLPGVAAAQAERGRRPETGADAPATSTAKVADTRAVTGTARVPVEGRVAGAASRAPRKRITGTARVPGGGTIPVARLDGSGMGSPAKVAPRNPWLRLIDRHGRLRVLAVSAAVLFVAVMGAVLAFELVVGKPLAAAVTGQEGSGTSIGGELSSQSGTSTGTTGDKSGTDDAPSDTSNLPPDGQDAGTGSGTTSDEPTEAPTGDPTDAPSSGDETGDGDSVGGGTETTPPEEETDGTEPESTTNPSSAPTEVGPDPADS